MAELILHFLSAESAQLETTEFQHPLLSAPLTAVRGKTSGTSLCSGSFQWTLGVLALSYLCVKAKGAHLRFQEHFVLAGEAGTPAASLDYAIAKAPQWIIDMFGTDSDGVSLLRRVITRSNPERKRPGPVTLRVNQHQLNPDDITITLNGTPLGDASALDSLAQSLESQIHAATSGQVHAPPKRPAAKKPQSPCEQLLSSIGTEIGFRDEWLPVVNLIVNDTRTIIRGTAYDHEVRNWWSSLPGKAYLLTNLALLKKGVSVQRLFLLTDRHSPTQHAALQFAYLQELLGIEVRIADAAASESISPRSSAMISIHDDLFAAVHHPKEAHPITAIENRKSHVTELRGWYDELFTNPFLAALPSTLLAQYRCPPELIAQTKRLARNLRAQTNAPLGYALFKANS